MAIEKGKRRMATTPVASRITSPRSVADEPAGCTNATVVVFVVVFSPSLHIGMQLHQAIVCTDLPTPTPTRR